MRTLIRKRRAEMIFLLQLIDDYSYDKQVMNGAIAIEIDSETGEVYSAFFATKCKG